MSGIQDFLNLVLQQGWISYLVLIIVTILLLYYYINRDIFIWESKGIKSVKPYFIYGSHYDLFTQKKSEIDHHKDIYTTIKDHKFGLVYEGFEPTIYFCDPDLIKRVMVTDFEHFTDFGFNRKDIANLEGNTFGFASLNGNVWKEAKAKVGQLVNWKQIKGMIGFLNDNAIDAMKVFSKSAENNEEINMKEKMDGYVLNCIAKITCGIDTDAYNNTDSEFFKLCNDIIMAFGSWRAIVSTLFPSFMVMFNIPIMPKEMTDTLNRFIDGIKVSKQSSPPRARKDFLDSFLEFQKNDPKFTDDLILASMNQMFVDGYTPSLSCIHMVFHFLVNHPNVQIHVQNEIDKLYEECGININAEKLNEMKYLDQVFDETTRLCSMAVTQRTCTKDWKIPDTDIIIPEGMRVQIGITGVQTDSDYWDNPGEFNPERFNSENKGQIRSGTFLPFGDGPRQCFGKKIVQLEIKIFMYHLLRNFNLKPCSKTKKELVWDKNDFLEVDGGVWIKLEKRIM